MAVSPIIAARMLDKPVVPVRLREYQDNLLGSVSRSLGRHEAAILQLPTGGGKTHIAAEFAKEASEAGQSVWLICHRREIIAQTGKALDETGVAHGFLAPGHKLAIDAKVQVGSVDYLRGKVGLLPDPSFIIWDECHHVPAPSWARLKEQYPNARHLGLTATPLRLDGLGLGEFFDDLIVGPDTRQLIEWGFLSGYRLFAPSIPDLRGIETRMGDYSKPQLNERMTDEVLVGDVIDHYKRKANGKKALVFAVSISASKDVVERFNAAGIPARHVDGNTPTDERDETIAALASGKVKVVSNVEVFTEGFDLPSVGAIILLRPTRSVALYRQMVGRGLRADGGKRTVILDHAGLFYEHGMPDDFIQWSLEGKARTPSDKLRSKPLRRCPECDAVHEWALSCEACGHVYAANERTIEEAFGELMEVVRRPGWATPSEFAKIAGLNSYNVVRRLAGLGLPRDAKGMVPIRDGLEWLSSNGYQRHESARQEPPEATHSGEYEPQPQFAKRIGYVKCSRLIDNGLPIASNGWVHVERGLAWFEEYKRTASRRVGHGSLSQIGRAHV